MRTPELARPGHGSRICARTNRTSSRIASSSCSTRNPRAGMPPGTGCSTTTISSLRFKVAGKDIAIEPTLNLLQDRDGKKRKVAAEALARIFKANERTFALITNTLAKDKEISDRWRGFKDVADSHHLDDRVEREVVDALVGAVRAAYPRLSAPATTGSRPPGSKRKGCRTGTAMRRCPLRQRARLPGAMPSTWCCRPTAASRRKWPGCRAFFHRPLDRCAGLRPGTAPSDFASDDAVGASLCADGILRASRAT